jgi:hypothetical protein
VVAANRLVFHQGISLYLFFYFAARVIAAAAF